MRRPDASMSLLTELSAGALEPEYRDHADKPPSRLRFGVTVALLAGLITLALLQTTRGANITAEQHTQLQERITSARVEQEALTAQAAELEAEVRSLGEKALADPGQRAQLESLEAATGALALTGPGMVVTVGDAPDASSAQGLVLDSDLSRLVNGLWTAGAEAIAINGQRLTVMTPIRSAGAAITVDYVSLSPPYAVTVLGDPETLEAHFEQTQAAQWWQYLTQNYGLTMTIAVSDEDLEVPADAGMTLRYAEQG